MQQRLVRFKKLQLNLLKKSQFKLRKENTLIFSTLSEVTASGLSVMLEVACGRSTLLTSLRRLF
jgi:hypothetical protein